MGKQNTVFNRLSRTVHTIRHLEPRQFIFFLLRRGFPVRKTCVCTCAPVRTGVCLKPLLPVSTFRDTEEAFTALNRTEVFLEQTIDWQPKSQSRLWRYHLHYFDQLRDTKRSCSNKIFLLNDWIKANPQGSQPAWEAYTASLRIVNWIAFFLSEEAPKPLPQHWLLSLYEQTLWLEKNDERHILANHYFENIKAWLFAGVFFSGKKADDWLSRGQKLLVNQLREQFLSDGGHYERSPQYHSLMIENVLDLLNLASSNPDLFDSDTVAALNDTANGGVEFSQRIAYPDGSYPLFNDSTHGIGPEALELLSYYKRILSGPMLKRAKFINLESTIQSIKPEWQSKPALQLINEPDSGLYGIRHENNQLVIDCGDIGPCYQPGHTHCDFLSFELMLDKKPVIVDSGVYEYQAGKMRRYVRSTAAHNTVVVDGKDQSEMWGEFRVARRAKKLNAKIHAVNEFCVEFKGRFKGFPAIEGGIIHQRQIRCMLSGTVLSLLIQDEIEGKGNHVLASYLHFHPEIEPKKSATGQWGLYRDEKQVAELCVMGEANSGVVTRLEEGWYCPEFGLKTRNRVLVMTVEQSLPTQLSYQINKKN